MITKRKALALARKKFGKDALIRDHGPEFDFTDEERSRAIAEYENIGKSVPVIPGPYALPNSATIGEYRVVVEQFTSLISRWRKLRHIATARRFQVGHGNGMINHIRGSGRSLEEALRAAGVEVE